MRMPDAPPVRNMFSFRSVIQLPILFQEIDVVNWNEEQLDVLVCIVFSYFKTLYFG